ncbi:MAG: leucyl aminopeptidase family protein [Planctomycetes bacterium]|nr:leucyl aminopeptidase family protein [Planctomycetota bacterium]
MKFTFPRDGKALASADHVLVVAAVSCFARRKRAAVFDKLLDKDTAALAIRLGDGAGTGLLGSTATSLIGKRRLTIGALRDEISRHNCDARAESIRKVTAAAALGNTKNAVLLVLDDPSHLTAAVNAIGRALPTFNRKSKKSGGSVAITAATRQGKSIAIGSDVQDLVANARAAAHLVDTPPTELDPAALARAAKAMLRGIAGVKVQEITGDALLKKGLGGIHAVGRTARSAPRLLIATAGANRKGRHIALVGKGVTYDTGGLNLKIQGAMSTMKGDMGGAAAVLGAFATLARHQPPCRISLVMCLAENAIGPGAYKPDDVITMHSGKTVEINNTDAEGRLLLADGCSYAARVLKADTIVDAATLTGAQGIATGNLHAAIVSNDEGLEQALVAAGRASGDLCWPLPFAPEFFRSEFSSPIADMRNSVKNRTNAQSSCAAEFVHWHLDGTGVRWGHIDLAFPAMRGDRGTGFGVALLVDAVHRLGRR